MTDEQKIEIVSKYKTGKYTCAFLGREYSVSTPAICSILKIRGVSVNNNQSELQRKYSLDESFFNTIDTEEKAYFLGLLYADGCNYTVTSHVFIGLQVDDIQLLKQLNAIIKSNRPIKISPQTGKGSKDIATLHINSKKISSDLTNLGCVRAKSLILEFPTEDQVPKHLIRHFLRGYWDGDGSIGIYRTQKPYLKSNVVSTKTFCYGVQNIFKSIFDMDYAIVSKGKDHNILTGQISISNTINSFRFLSWIYYNASIFMKRKYNKYLLGSSLLEEEVKLKLLLEIQNIINFEEDSAKIVDGFSE